MRVRQGLLTRVVLAFLAGEIAIAAGLALVGSFRAGRSQTTRAAHRLLVSELGLTDLALWSDASYCRHPSLSVFFSAHADHPSAMEHFPAGAMVPPPRIEEPIRGSGQ